MSIRGGSRRVPPASGSNSSDPVSRGLLLVSSVGNGFVPQQLRGAAGDRLRCGVSSGFGSAMIRRSTSARRRSRRSWRCGWTSSRTIPRRGSEWRTQNGSVGGAVDPRGGSESKGPLHGEHEMEAAPGHPREAGSRPRRFRTTPGRPPPEHPRAVIEELTHDQWTTVAETATERLKTLG
jgi:hypothetical protein